jgi:DUF4097 and DUF4098 domain-containing protein YvlB
VRVFRLDGPLDATTSNATIELTQVNGNVTAHTSNGAVRADGVKGAIEATTSNGSINVRLSNPEQGRPIRLASSNGSIELALDRINGNDVRASTSNSSITLRLPSNLAAQVRAHTSNGSIATDYELSVRGGGKISKSHIDGAIGSGGPLLDLSSSNGNIRLLRL